MADRKTDADETSSGKGMNTQELREWYNRYHSKIESFEKTERAMNFLVASDNKAKTFNTFNKDKLRTYLENPLSHYKELRGLSRFLYYRSQVYRRLINYNADMIDLNLRSVIPNIDISKEEVDEQEVLTSYYETLKYLEKINLPLEFLKVYIRCWKEDTFFGCVYDDDQGVFILPLDPDCCKVTGVYNSGDLAFDMDMSFFSRQEELLDLWGEPFVSMYQEYQRDTVNNRWQPMPDENCICLKLNIDDWETPLPPYMALFNSLINLEDLNEITAIADEQMIYKLLVATIPLMKNAKRPDDFSVDPDTAIMYFKRILETLPTYANAVLSPIPIEAVEFDHDQSTDVNRIENATKAVLNTSGGAQILNSASLDGATAWVGAMKADEEYALSSLLPQTQAWVNRFLKYKINNPAKVKFLEITKYTKDTYKESIRQDATYGLPVKLMLNNLNGFSELDTLSMNVLENDILKLHKKFIPLQSSNTMNTGDLINMPDEDVEGEPVEGADTKAEGDGSDGEGI